jgi:hypothetical protein
MRVTCLVAIILAAGLVGSAIAAWLIPCPDRLLHANAEAPLDGTGDPAKGEARVCRWRLRLLSCFHRDSRTVCGMGGGLALPETDLE